MAAVVLAISLCLQFLAAAWALGLARLTGRSPAWTCLAAAIGLMGVRRLITLTRIIAGNDTVPADLTAETVALLISILMVLGIGSIGPLVRRLQRTEVVLELNRQLQQEVEQRQKTQEALEHEQRSLTRLLQASDHERRLIGYEIHDGLAQQLAAAIMHLQMHESRRSESPEQADDELHAAAESLRQAHSEARRLIRDVRPPVLDESGIEAALYSLVQSVERPEGPRVEFQCVVRFDRLPAVLENAIYRMAQQAVTNACQYSQSERLKVSLFQEGDLLHLEVQDWGIGFDPKTVPDDRFGLEGIRERARLLGGELAVESEPGKGTYIRVTLPIGATMDKLANRSS